MCKFSECVVGEIYELASDATTCSQCGNVTATRDTVFFMGHKLGDDGLIYDIFENVGEHDCLACGSDMGFIMHVCEDPDE